MVFELNAEGVAGGREVGSMERVWMCCVSGTDGDPSQGQVGAV